MQLHKRLLLWRKLLSYIQLMNINCGLKIVETKACMATTVSTLKIITTLVGHLCSEPVSLTLLALM